MSKIQEERSFKEDFFRPLHPGLKTGYRDVVAHNCAAYTRKSLKSVPLWVYIALSRSTVVFKQKTVLYNHCTKIVCERLKNTNMWSLAHKGSTFVKA